MPLKVKLDFVLSVIICVHDRLKKTLMGVGTLIMLFIYTYILTEYLYGKYKFKLFLELLQRQ